eukprot:283337-Chlamydomonas_euryale.AAC.8
MLCHAVLEGSAVPLPVAMLCHAVLKGSAVPRPVAMLSRRAGGIGCPSSCRHARMQCRQNEAQHARLHRTWHSTHAQ